MMNDINQRLAKLSPAKRALLEQKLKEKSLEKNRELSIPRSANSDSASLSFSQVRMWLLDQLEPGNPAYNRPTNIHLTGQLNVAALEQSLNEIVRRHDILRTSFPAVDGQPVQVISATLTLSLPIVDLSYLVKNERESEVQRLANQEAQQSFNLSQLPLIKAILVRLSAEEHILLLTLHHIIFDGWSMGVLTQEIAALYEAFSTGKLSFLPELPIQYADFAEWQRQRWQDKGLESQLAYWKKQLGGNLPVLELPTDRSRGAVQTFRGARHSLVLPKTLTQALKELSQREGVTLFMTLLAAFQTLLYRYTGQDDIIVGTPIAGRDRTETEKLIGVFINTLVLRTQIDSNLTVRELLGRVREVALGAYNCSDIPFEKLVQELQLDRNLSRTPLFQILFQLRNLPNEAVEVQGLKIEDCQLETGMVMLDLALEIEEQPEGLYCTFKYNKDLFNTATIEQISVNFQTLLEGIIANPNQEINNLSILSSAERQRLQNCKNLVTVDRSFTEFPKAAIEQSIPDRFSEQVDKYPDRIAVSTKNYQWTYRNLNDLANAIAQFILKHYGNSDERIALLLEHDAPAIAAILGVLKAGKTYVPLDPTYPQLRLSYILENSQATALLSNRKNLALAEELAQEKIPFINLDEIDFSLTNNEVQNTVSPDTLAYILYTSGSTGQPKGVIQNHRNVLHFIRNYTNNLHIAFSDRLTLLSSYSFDAAVMDIFGALLNGATLYPIDIKEEGLTDLAEWLEAREITIYHSTPTVYRQFLRVFSANSLEKIRFSKLRLIVLGGEEVVKSDVELYQKYFTDRCILVNGLGSTESSFNLQYLIDQNTQITQPLVPVGYPFDDTEILLLNEAGNVTDLWGEIAIRSPHIALGYWQKPELTEAAFLADPQGGNRRIYRTGDLGRLRVDGTIEFLGRRDFQVKIRGLRIELGEIEANLAQHPSVKETVVIADRETSEDKRLIAYVVAHPDSVPTAVELRNFLQDRLPSYMIPAAFVLLDALPLTLNGKINRRALPAPDLQAQKSTKTLITPRNDLELRLVKIWEKVLGVQPIGIQDDFFELGGHSLIAIQLFSQIHQLIGADIPLATLFKAPTIEKLARLISQEGWSTAWLSLVPIKPEGSQLPFFFHGGAADAMTWAKFGRQLSSDRPFYGLQLPALDGKQKFQDSVEEIAADCLKEIRTIQPNGPYLLGGHCFGGTIAFEIAQQLLDRGEEVAFLALVDAYAPKSVPNDRLLWRMRANIHKWYFLLHKTYYYHADELRKRPLVGKLTYLSNWLGDKLARKRLIKINSQSQKSPNNMNLKSEQTEKKSHLFQHKDQFVPYEIRYHQAHQANREVKTKYSPQVYPGRITLFRAKTQKLDWYFGQELGWSDLVEGGIECHEIPGLNSNLFNQRSLPLLVEKVRDCLEKVQKID